MSLATCMGLEFLVHSSGPTQSYVLNYKKNKRKYFHLDKKNCKQFFKKFKNESNSLFLCTQPEKTTKQNKIKKSIPFPRSIILLKFVPNRTHTRNVFTDRV